MRLIVLDFGMCWYSYRTLHLFVLKLGLTFVETRLVSGPQSPHPWPVTWWWGGHPWTRRQDWTFTGLIHRCFFLLLVTRKERNTLKMLTNEHADAIDQSEDTLCGCDYSWKIHMWWIIDGSWSQITCSALNQFLPLNYSPQKRFVQTSKIIFHVFVCKGHR